MNTTQNIDTTAIDLISYQDARRTTELGPQILEVEQLLWIAGGGGHLLVTKSSRQKELRYAPSVFGLAFEPAHFLRLEFF